MSARLNRGPRAKATTLSSLYTYFMVAVLAVPQLVDAQPLPAGTNQTPATVDRGVGIKTANVRINNQSELGSRAQPAAGYLATVHRKIHHVWADGFLAGLDRKPSTGRYPLDLVTALAISLKSDGTVNQVSISRGSGFWSFDAAAIEAVLLAAPFPAPPQSIKRPDGNLYVTWLFHRDDRQCALDFVRAHILAPPVTPTPAAPTLAAPPVAVSEPAGSAAEPAELCSPPVYSAVNATRVPADAQAAAESWLLGYNRGDVSRLAASSAVPFTDGGTMVVETQASLEIFYVDLVVPKTLKPESVRYYTAAQIKKLRGSLPRGGEKEDMAFAWIERGGEDLILILQPACQGWRVVGIDH